MQLGGPPSAPPALSCTDPLPDALSQPRLKVPRSHRVPPSHEGCLSQASVPHHLHCKPGSEEGCAAAFCVVWRQFLLEFSHFCFLGRKQTKIQKIPAPARSSSDLGGIYFLAFPIALLSGSIPLHSCPPWAMEQKHRNSPPLSFFLLVNYFISFPTES